MEERVFTGVTGGVADLYGIRVVIKFDSESEAILTSFEPH
jgi:ppGpp synthetase/RelA/SpoT-type nucleotidyltranferase